MIKGITLTLLKINLETFKTFRGPLLDKLVTGQVLFWGTKYDKPTLIEQKLLLKHTASKPLWKQWIFPQQIFFTSHRSECWSEIGWYIYIFVLFQWLRVPSSIFKYVVFRWLDVSSKYFGRWHSRHRINPTNQRGFQGQSNDAAAFGGQSERPSSAYGSLAGLHGGSRGLVIPARH